MNFDIPTLCCNFVFIIASISLFKNNTKKKQDVSKNMPCCHFLLIVIVVAVRLVYKEFFKNTRMSILLIRMLLRIGFFKLLIFCLFPKFIRCNTEAKN